MSHKLWLTEEEVIELTGRVRPSAQLKQLASLGYDVRHRADGTFIVPANQFIVEGERRSKTKQAKLNLEALK